MPNNEDECGRDRADDTANQVIHVGNVSARSIKLPSGELCVDLSSCVTGQRVVISRLDLDRLAQVFPPAKTDQP